MTFFLGPRAASLGYRLAAFESIGSTNAEALARARLGERGPIWFVTSEQTAGRGRRHRPWIAPRGNLASSILEVIGVSPAVAATLGFAAGLALEAALQKVSIEAALRSPGSDHMMFSLKWPNDVLAGQQNWPASCWKPRLSRTTNWPSWWASAPTSSRRRRVCQCLRRRSRRSASTSGPRNCLPPYLTRGRNFESFGTMAVALGRSGGSGSRGRRGWDRRYRFSLPAPRSKAHSTPSTIRAA